MNRTLTIELNCVKIMLNFKLISNDKKLGTQNSNISYTLGLKIRKSYFKEMPLIKGFSIVCTKSLPQFS